jgi:hypothetical protein
MERGKKWIFPKEMNANRFFWDSHWLAIWSNHLCPSMGLNAWRDRGYGLRRFSEVLTVLWPKDQNQGISMSNFTLVLTKFPEENELFLP